MTTVSVVVASRDRAALLPRLLAALDAQDTGPPEVVVVDDASSDQTRRVLADLASTRGHLRFVSLPSRRGPAAARNVGWRAASGKVIAFTDDDCVPGPSWVGALVAAVEAGADVAQGATSPDPAQSARVGPFSRTMEVTAETGYYQTCNVAYRRDCLERLGGFDERFRRAAGEDTDLAWRARAAGARTTFVADALVHHDVRPSSLRAQLADTPRWEAVVLCARSHPGLRRLFHRPWCWKASHPPALLALAGLALATGPAVAARPATAWSRLGAVALTAPYLRYRVFIEPLRGGPRRRTAAIPGALLLDLAEVAVLARASLRHRSLVL